MDGDFGVFSNGGQTPGVPLEFQGENGLLPSCGGKVGIFFAVEAGEWTLISREGVENGDLLALWCETQCSSHVGMCISGNFLSCMKGVRYTFAFQEGT